MNCKDCEHAYKLDSYRDEHEIGMLHCDKIFTLHTLGTKINDQKKRILITESDCHECGGVQMVHEDFGCIHFERK